MCGRFAQTIPLKDLISLFFADEIKTECGVSYNIAPSDQVAALIINNKKRILGDLKWGLIPAWSKEPSISYNLINARGETVHEKPSFKEAFLKRRCLIPATGFFEWQKSSAEKQPWHIETLSKPVMAMAGLYETWRSPDGKKISTCAIVTTEANAAVQAIHHRMPVIIQQKDEEVWLSGTAEDARALILPWDSDDMKMTRVSDYVNSPRHNSPQCIRPV